MRPAYALLLSAALASAASAQTTPDTTQQSEKNDRSGIASFGVAGGTIHFGDGGYERAISAALVASLSHGFFVSVNPTYAWAQAAPSVDATTGLSVTPAPVHGIADLPVSLGYWHTLPGSWSPSFGLSLGATLPIGDTTKVGSGETAFGANFDLSVEPVSGWSVGAGTGHSLSNGYASGLGSIAPTTVSFNLTRSAGPVDVNVGYATEMGPMPAGTSHSQTVLGGASFSLGGSASLNVSGSTGTADGVRSWAAAVGVGTTFADVARVSPFAAASRLANALGKGRTMGSSRSTAAKAAAAARKMGKKFM